MNTPVTQPASSSASRQGAAPCLPEMKKNGLELHTDPHLDPGSVFVQSHYTGLREAKDTLVMS